MGKTKRSLIVEIKATLRDVRTQLALLNRNVSSHLALREIDLDCLDVIGRHGPLTPRSLAVRVGLHPATLTGILDRLERAGWIIRERDPAGADRRAVHVRALPDRNGELYQRLAPMNEAMDGVCAEFTDAELATVARFLRRTAEAGESANSEVSS
ncbi:MarR family transcriptional regulator [Propionibacteriaceae bacterium Y2011]